MKDILEQIISGELTRDNDEKHAGGLWDYAGEIIFDSNANEDEELQANIYYALWEMAELLTEGDGGEC
jgi:hypothetical protein